MTKSYEAAYGHASENGHCCGLTKREHFASQAMIGELANSSDDQWPDDKLAVMADRSVRAADELIKALNKEKRK